jgi:hypothetical protein
MSYRELPVQMHPRYNEFLKFMVDCPHRKTPECMQTAFWAWLKAQSSDSQDLRDLAIFSSEQAVEIQILKNDLDRLHRERDSFQEQARVMAECVVNDVIINYAIWQAISDLERVCRHRTATAAEDWLQVEAENRTHIPTIEYALEVLKACGVQLDEKIGFPNIRIIYDRSKNKFFGKS